MPIELKININGNNNRIEIEYPQKITNVRISMSNDNNLFSMKATQNKFANRQGDNRLNKVFKELLIANYPIREIHERQTD